MPLLNPEASLRSTRAWVCGIGLLFILFIFAPPLLLADDCSADSDCFPTLGAAAAAATAAGVLAAGAIAAGKAAASSRGNAKPPAAHQGDKVYIKQVNTKLMVSTAPTSDVSAVLQLNTQVTYQGRDPSNPRYVKVEYQGKTGYVYHTDVSTEPVDTTPQPSNTARPDEPAIPSPGVGTKA